MWHLAELAEVLGNTVHEDPVVRRIVIDSREVEEGDCFVALRGEHHDGHDFLEDARKRGAVAVLVTRPYPDLPSLVVDDTREALWRLAQWWREKLRGHVVAITGTAGKTTTKELLRYVFEPWGPVCATPASYNSTLGLPLSILACSPDARWIFWEIGINKPGEMERLAGLARPQDSVIVSLGPAHLAFFESYQHYLEEKLRILDFLPQGGRVFHPAFKEDEGRVFLSKLPAHVQSIETPVAEEAWQHTWSARTIAGIAEKMASAYGLPIEAVRERIRSFGGMWGRKMIIHIGAGTWVHDAYNANPLSVQETLVSFSNRALTATLILGDMLELGEEEERWHRWVGRWVARLGYRNLYAVGKRARWIAEEAATYGVPAQWYPSVSALIDTALEDLLQAPLVILKASRGMALEQIVEAARARTSSGSPKG